LSGGEVPEHDEGVEPESHGSGALDGVVLSVLRVLEAELALALVEGVFEGPPSSKGLDDRLRVHRGVRGDEDVVAFVTREIADHDKSHQLGPCGYVPEGVDDDLHGPPIGSDLDALPSSRGNLLCG
jgi:hypothetical protein